MPNAKVKAKVAAQLDGIQQSIMDVQNALREFQETGHCRGCENSIRMLENQVADLSWFFLATKPELLKQHILPQLNKLRTWVDQPDAVPNVHQVIGDLMTKSAYEFLLLKDRVWDDAFWVQVERGWTEQSASLNWPPSLYKRAEKGYKEALSARP